MEGAARASKKYKIKCLGMSLLRAFASLSLNSSTVATLASFCHFTATLVTVTDMTTGWNDIVVFINSALWEQSASPHPDVC